MAIRIIDYPHKVAEPEYQEALLSMTRTLMQSKSVIAVYQVGGVSSPGISDLDMVVVFEDGVREEKNFLNGLSKEERYLFIHSLYGISINNFADAERFAFYHHYRLLGGREVRSYSRLSETEIQTLKIQIALEFMVKMHITLFLQHSYKVLRMRDLLLHVKALQYDLDFLGSTPGAVHHEVSKVIEWRSDWFQNKPSEAEIISWWKKFYVDFNLLLDEKLAHLPFYLPDKKSFRISKNILLSPATQKVVSSQKGFMLPDMFSAIGKKYFRLQNMLNSFQFEIPAKTEGSPGVILNKFHFERSIVEYNKKYLPYFLPLTSSLNAI